MWFLFQDILTFTGNNVEPQYDYPLLQPMIKVFYLFKIQFKFDGDEVLEVFIELSLCNRIASFQIYDVKQNLLTNK